MQRIRNAASFAVIEPRITHIQRELERLLALVELEHEGSPVRVTGFRLRNLEQWRSAHTNTAMNALTPISGLCNSRCDFCFEENIPYPRERSLMSVAEAATRLRHYSPETGQALFPSNRPHMETFLHPQAVDIIELARRREPGKLFWITTNGSHFDEPTVARLAELRPLIFKLSINSIDPDTNRALMKTGRLTEVSLRAPELLHRHRIPFMGSIVAWPTLSLDDIEATVRHLERFSAYAVRIRLPLSHRWLEHQPDVDLHEHWQRVGRFAHELRQRVRVALFCEPPIYWVNPIIPEVDGVVFNSPAYHAGLRPGDVIESIDGAAIHTRIESEAALDRAHLAGAAVDVVARRGDRSLAVRLDPQAGDDSYPYDPSFFYRGENYGVFHVEDFRLNHIEQLLDVIERHGAREVLLFSSAIVAPIFETLVNHIPYFRDRLASINLYIECVTDNTAGGNYDVMDSRFVEDYARVIRRRLAQGRRIDLILIPDGFGSSWGMDMGGVSYTALTMEFGIPVELIDWLLVYGREV